MCGTCSVIPVVEMAREDIALILLCVGHCVSLSSPTTVVDTLNDIETTQPLELSWLQKLRDFGRQNTDTRHLQYDDGMAGVGLRNNGEGGEEQSIDAMEGEVQPSNSMMIDTLCDTQLGTAKREFQPWGGKRSGRDIAKLKLRHQVVLQRRVFQPWGGKRSASLPRHLPRLEKRIRCLHEVDVDEFRVSERDFQPWGGKRRVTGKHSLLRSRYVRSPVPQRIRVNRRVFQPWGGKRSNDRIKTAVQERVASERNTEIAARASVLWKDGADRKLFSSDDAKKAGHLTSQKGVTLGQENDGHSDEHDVIT